MAQEATVSITPAEGWKQVTSADAAGSTSFFVLGGDVEVRTTTDTTQPAAGSRGIPVKYQDGWIDETLAAIFPGLAAGDRLWVLAPTGSTVIFSAV